MTISIAHPNLRDPDIASDAPNADRNMIERRSYGTGCTLGATIFLLRRRAIRRLTETTCDVL